MLTVQPFTFNPVQEHTYIVYNEKRDCCIIDPGCYFAQEEEELVNFITANGLDTLSIARFLQGIATGAAMTTLGACLVDLNPPHAPGRAGLGDRDQPASGSRGSPRDRCLPQADSRSRSLRTGVS